MADAQAAGRPVALLGFLFEPGGRQHQNFGFVLLRRGVSRPWRGAHRSGAAARLFEPGFCRHERTVRSARFS